MVSTGQSSLLREALAADVRPQRASWEPSIVGGRVLR
jgi:hypothetical protein